MYEDGRNDHCHRAESVGQNMQENPVHIFVAMRVVMSMIVAVVMVTMLETEDSDQVDRKASNANGEQFTDAIHFATGR